LKGLFEKCIWDTSVTSGWSVSRSPYKTATGAHKVYMGQSSYSDKVYTGTKFIQTFFILDTLIKEKINNLVLKISNSYNQIIYCMLVLVNYHKDTFFGRGKVRALTWWVGGYVYGERWRRHYLGVYMVNIHLQVETYNLE
jgi:hypothetical protein